MVFTTVRISSLADCIVKNHMHSRTTLRSSSSEFLTSRNLKVRIYFKVVHFTCIEAKTYESILYWDPSLVWSWHCSVSALSSHHLSVLLFAAIILSARFSPLCLLVSMKQIPELQQHNLWDLDVCYVQLYHILHLDCACDPVFNRWQLYALHFIFGSALKEI